MITVRRIYFYGLTLFSLFVVVWGVTGLLRTIISGQAVGESSLVPTALSLILLGAPVFWFHWRVVRREAETDPVERGSMVRAVTLYTACAAFLVAILSSTLALLNRGLVTAFGEAESAAWFGAEQSLADNLLAILVNGVALFFCGWLLRVDWRANLAENYLPEARRFYRYFWVLAGLSMAAAGVGNLLRYSLSSFGQGLLAAGISLLLIGLPLWGYHWWAVQESLIDPAERRSLLRLLVLYLVLLTGMLGALVALGPVVSSLLRSILDQTLTYPTFLRVNASGIGVVIPLTVISVYYGTVLSREAAGHPDQQRRFGLRRLFFAILSLLGLTLALTGLHNLLEYLARLVFATGLISRSIDSLLSGALAALLLGLPLWWVAWHFLQIEAARRDASGDKARRSVMRKAYLYLVLFLLFAGSLFFSARLLYVLLNTLLSQAASPNMGQDLTILILRLLATLAFLIYHWRVLRLDNRLARRTLGDLHAGFPTLVIGKENLFSELFLEEVHRDAPRLPVALHSVEQGAPDETLLAAKVILLPIGLALDPPESLRRWLEEYHGRRLLIPLEKEGYLLLGQSKKPSQSLARDAARAVRQMAEGEALLESLPGDPWSVAGYVLGGLVAIQLVGFSFFLLVTALFP